MLNYKNARLGVQCFIEWVSAEYDDKILDTEIQLYETQQEIRRLDRKYFAHVCAEFFTEEDRAEFDAWLLKGCEAIKLVQKTEQKLYRTLDNYFKIKEIQSTAKQLYDIIATEHGESIQNDVEL